ncbi:hypothetical protein [Ruminococcus albus]|nr:hypothetical protein [Ruminococcus albus]
MSKKYFMPQNYNKTYSQKIYSAETIANILGGVAIDRSFPTVFKMF